MSETKEDGETLSSFFPGFIHFFLSFFKLELKRKEKKTSRSFLFQPNKKWTGRARSWPRASAST